MADSIATIGRLCPITAGFAAPRRLLDDVSFINASGLVLRVAIRRAGTALAFFERPEWIRAWFPGSDAEVIELCAASTRCSKPGPDCPAALRRALSLRSAGLGSVTRRPYESRFASPPVGPRLAAGPFARSAVSERS